MKVVAKTIMASIVLAATGSAMANQEELSKKIEVKNPSEYVKSVCEEQLKDAPVLQQEGLKQQCWYGASQETAHMTIGSAMKKAKYDELQNVVFEPIKSMYPLLKVTETLNEVLLQPEGKLAEYDRIGSMFKNPEIEITVKQQEEADYFKKFNKDNYKVTKEEYAQLVKLHNNFKEQAKEVFQITNLIDLAQQEQLLNLNIPNMPVEQLAEFKGKELAAMKEKSEKRKKQDEKHFNNKVYLSNYILTDLETLNIARKLEVRQVLDKVLAGNDVKLGKQECVVFKNMYKDYGIKEFDNLSCAWFKRIID